jgi:hypothetical protein
LNQKTFNMLEAGYVDVIRGPFAMRITERFKEMKGGAVTGFILSGTTCRSTVWHG